MAHLKKKLKIAIFTDTFVPALDGVVTTTLNLAMGMADRGHKVFIIAPKYPKSGKFHYKNVIVKRVASMPAFFYTGYRFSSLLDISILKELKKEKIDVIHFQTPISLGVQAIMAAKFLKTPIIGTFHTFFTDEQYIKHIGFNKKSVQRFSWSYARGYYNKCDIITCPTESAKKELLKNKFKNPIKVISNGIDLKLFQNSAWKKAKKKYNPSGKILLFVGRIGYEKNLDYLLECFKLVVDKDKTVKLVIVGNGPQFAEIKDKIKMLGLSQNVTMTGRIENKNLIASGIYGASDVFVTASTTETQGITALEAQASGLVCVGIDAKGIKDIIRNNYNGFLVKDGDKKGFADKVLMLLKDENLQKKMGMNATKEISKHKIKDVISIWEELYGKLVSKKKRARALAEMYR